MNELNKKTCKAQYFYTRSHSFTLAIVDMSKFWQIAIAGEINIVEGSSNDRICAIAYT